MPREVIAKLNGIMVRVLANPAARKHFHELGIQVAPLDRQSPEALREFQKQEAARWWPIINASGIKPE